MNPVAAAVPGDSYDILVDPTGSTAYFPFYGGGLAEYDIATGAFGATVDFPRFVYDAELAADGAWIEAVDVGSSALVRAPVSDPSAWTSTPVGSSAWALALSPDGSLAYVTDSDLDVLHVVETATGTVLDSIPVGAMPLGVVVSPDGTRGYVAAYGDRAVSVVDLVVGATIATVPLAQGAEEVAVSPDGATVYAVGYDSRMLTAIDVAGVRPTVGAVSPDHGPVAGGTTVGLTGSDFDGTTAVTFGGVAGTDLSIAPDGRSLTVVTPPAAAAGVVDIVIQHAAGDTPVGSFRYDAAGGGVRLADTGVELLPLGLVGVALVVGGVVLASRRRLLRV
jgi:YVTN family beta-propeller protein